MILITAHGRLAHQPELKLGPQTSWTEFRLLSTRWHRGQEHTEAVTFVCFGEVAERFCEACERGQQVSASGTQETRRWQDPGGQERTLVRYQLTWWEAGPKPRRQSDGNPPHRTQHRDMPPRSAPSRGRSGRGLPQHHHEEQSSDQDFF